MENRNKKVTRCIVHCITWTEKINQKTDDYPKGREDFKRKRRLKRKDA
jgi:hypothetical protein